MFSANTMWENDLYSPNEVTVFVPLPLETIRRLKERAESIEFCKNDYMRAVQNSGRMPFGVRHFELAAMFLQYVIYQEYVPAYKKNVLDACLALTTCFAKPQSLESIGISKTQVLVHVAGIQIVLMDLQQAIYRSDLFSSIHALQQVAKRDYTLPSSPKAENLKESSSHAAVVGVVAKKSPSSILMKRCSKGSKCPHVLSGKCGLAHSKRDISEAGAIVQKQFAISPCKVNPLVDCLDEVSTKSGANVSLLQPHHDGTTHRILQFTGSRLAVDKAIQLVIAMEQQAKTTTTTSESLMERVLTITQQQKQTLGGAALKVIADTSATKIWLQEDSLLYVQGTKQALDNGIQLLQQWWNAHCKQDEVEATTTSTAKEISTTTVPLVTEEESSNVQVVKESSNVQATSTSDVSSNLTNGETESSGGVSFNLNNDGNGGETEPISASRTSENATTFDEPVKLVDDSAWPSLNPQGSKNTLQRATTMLPVLDYASKAALPPAQKENNKTTTTTVLQALKKREPRSTVTKINYKHPCIHGANCQFIQSGRDECKFFHSTQELQQAAARFTEQKLYLAPAAVGWIIGSQGLRLKELERESGAIMFIDQDSMGAKENRILHIRGTQSCVNNAIEMVKKLLPDGGDSSNVPSTDASAASMESVAKKEAPIMIGTTGAVNATKLVPSKNSSKRVERIIYLSHVLVGDVVGKKGAQVMAFQQNSGAKIDIDKERKGKKENRRVRISGKQSCVNAAIAMIQAVLPRGYEFESGPGIVSSSTAIVPVAKDVPAAKPKGTAVKKSKDTRVTGKKSRNLEHVMYISPAVVGWIIGQDGKRLKERIAKRGADLFIDSDSMRLSENKIVYITARSQKSIDAAVDMVMEQLPEGYTPESGPGLPSSADDPASSINSSPKSIPSCPPDNQFDTITEDPSAHPVTTEHDHASVASVPHQQPGFQQFSGSVAPPPGFQQLDANPVSPPRPIRQHVQIQQLHDAPGTNATFAAQALAIDRVSPTGIDGENNAINSTTVAMEGPTVFSSEDYPPQAAKVSPPVAKASTNQSLLSFLKRQDSCIKGSPEALCEWLSSEDIVNLVDLSEAVADDEYFHGVLQRGDGNVGVKGFKRAVFKKAVTDATAGTNASPTRSLLHDFAG